MKVIALGCVLLALSACASSSVQLDSRWNRKTKPTFEDYYDYYFLGFSGHANFSLQKICVDQKPYGVLTARTVEDTLLTLVTLGIYAPMTVDVWCGD